MSNPEAELYTLAQIVERFRGKIGRTNLVAHLKRVPQFAGGPTHRRNGAKYIFTEGDIKRLLESLAAPSAVEHRPLAIPARTPMPSARDSVRVMAKLQAIIDNGKK